MSVGCGKSEGARAIKADAEPVTAGTYWNLSASFLRRSLILDACPAPRNKNSCGGHD